MSPNPTCWTPLSNVQAKYHAKSVPLQTVVITCRPARKSVDQKIRMECNPLWKTVQIAATSNPNPKLPARSRCNHLQSWHHSSRYHAKNLAARARYFEPAKRAWKFMTFCHVKGLPQLFKWKLHFSISWMSSSRFVHVIHGMSAARNFSHPEQFLHSRNLFAQKPLSTKTTIHNSFYRQSVFTQKILRTEILRTEGFTHSLFYIQTILHADVLTQTQIAHRNLCTQYAFTHNQLLHRQVLFPLLDHLPFVSPFQVKNFWQ